MTALSETRGEKFGRLAFAYCKIATVCLLCGRFALPVAGILSGTFFVAGWIAGKRDTKCYLRYPLAIAALWYSVAAIWLWCEFAATTVPGFLHWIHR